ncbi:hypothetical protein GCM10027093_33790 [Paraburkholderia jirisanensis]
MIEDFFEIGFYYNDPTRWYLGQPMTSSGKVLPGTFWNCLPWVEENPLSVEIRKDGMPATFNYSGFSIYIVEAKTLALIQTITNPGFLQRIPVSIIGNSEHYEILNVLDRVDCLDEQHSEFRRWTADDGRPERIGDYKVSLLRIDPERAKGHDLFRIKGWEIALICSDKIKQCLEKAGVTGIRFKPVVHRETKK